MRALSIALFALGMAHCGPPRTVNAFRRAAVEDGSRVRVHRVVSDVPIDLVSRAIEFGLASCVDDVRTTLRGPAVEVTYHARRIERFEGGPGFVVQVDSGSGHSAQTPYGGDFLLVVDLAVDAGRTIVTVYSSRWNRSSSLVGAIGRWSFDGGPPCPDLSDLD